MDRKHSSDGRDGRGRERPLVSAVIPTRDRCDLVLRAVASVQRQVDVEVEIIVVDEGSRDATGARLSALADDRLVYLRNERPTGVARARNRGIAAAHGEWIAFLDDDDLWAPTKLRSQLQACDAANADFAYTGLVSTDPDLEHRHVSAPPDPRTVAEELLGTNVIGPPSSLIVHRSLLERTGAFDPDFSILADWELWLRLAAEGRAAACADPLTGYVRHPENMHLDVDGALKEFRRLRRKHAELAQRTGRKLGDLRWWGWVAYAQARSGFRYRSAALFFWIGLRRRRLRLIGRAVGLVLGDRIAGPLRERYPPEPQPAPDSQPISAAWLDAFAARSTADPASRPVPGG